MPQAAQVAMGQTQAAQVAKQAHRDHLVVAVVVADRHQLLFRVAQLLC
jgi:glycine cleavage system regulatory protein